MHDLGQWAHAHPSASPSMVQAQRFAATRGAAVGAQDVVIRHVAQLALNAWRATQRAQRLAGEQTIRSAFRVVEPGEVLIGVRVVLHLEFPEGNQGTQRDTFPIIINVPSNWTVNDIAREAMRLYNSGEATAGMRREYRGVAAGASIVQVVAGGFSQAGFAPVA